VTELADIWPAGVILFLMLYGKAPLQNPMQYWKITTAPPEVPPTTGPDDRSWSENAVKFLRCLLRFEPEERPTAEMALQDAWFKGASKPTELETDVAHACLADAFDAPAAVLESEEPGE
jgi:serine/threonine protein kinase